MKTLGLLSHRITQQGYVHSHVMRGNHMSFPALCTTLQNANSVLHLFSYASLFIACISFIIHTRTFCLLLTIANLRRGPACMILVSTSRCAFFSRHIAF